MQRWFRRSRNHLNLFTIISQTLSKATISPACMPLIKLPPLLAALLQFCNFGPPLRTLLQHDCCARYQIPHRLSWITGNIYCCHGQLSFGSTTCQIYRPWRKGEEVKRSHERTHPHIQAIWASSSHGRGEKRSTSVRFTSAPGTASKEIQTHMSRRMGWSALMAKSSMPRAPLRPLPTRHCRGNSRADIFR